MADSVQGKLGEAIKRLIDRGQTEGLKAKLDMFLLGDSITPEQYQELTQLLGQN